MNNNKGKNITGLLAIAIVIAAFTKSFWWGIFILAFVCLVLGEISERDNTIKTIKNLLPEEPKQKTLEELLNEQISILKTIEGKDKINISGTPTGFADYNGFIVESFANKLFRITDPNGKALDKLYTTTEEAKKVIDEMILNFEPQKYERQKIHNVSFVR